MSKKSVWNKGKHNGGTGASTKGQLKAAVVVEKTHEAEAASEPSRIDQVKPMNRNNWVSRPVRVTDGKPAE